MEDQNDQVNITPGSGNPTVQQGQSNQTFQTLLKSKYMMAILAAIVLLLAIIFSIVFMNAKSSNNTTTPTPTQSNQATYPSNSVSNPATSQSPSVGNEIITTPNPTEAVTIENQVQPQVTPAINFTYSNMKKFGDNWATAVVSNPSVEGGGLIMQKVNGAWKIVEGPGTFFPPSLLQSDGAPQALIDSFNPSTSPTLAP
jgi:cytoskeletal protein RodZ